MMNDYIIEKQFDKLKEKYPYSKLVINKNDAIVTISNFKIGNFWKNKNIDVSFKLPLGYPQACPCDFWVNTELFLENNKKPKGYYFCKIDNIHKFNMKLQSWAPNTDNILTYANTIKSRLNANMIEEQNE